MIAISSSLPINNKQSLIIKAAGLNIASIALGGPAHMDFLGSICAIATQKLVNEDSDEFFEKLSALLY